MTLYFDRDDVHYIYVDDDCRHHDQVTTELVSEVYQKMSANSSVLTASDRGSNMMCTSTRWTSLRNSTSKREAQHLLQNEHNEMPYLPIHWDTSRNTQYSGYFFKTTFHDWEEGAFKVFSTFIKPDSVVLDVGGWNGATAIFMSKI